MGCAVEERPQSSSRYGVACFATQQPRSNSEQDMPAQLQPFSLGCLPRKRVEQRKPGIFERRQFAARHAPRQKLGLNRLQTRFSWCILCGIERFQALPPPGEPDQAKVRIAACRYDVREGKVEAPKREKCRSNSRWQCLKRGFAISVEPSLSDR